MCGIAGALDLTGERAFPGERLRAMTGAIAHRGPDDEQVYHEPGLALGVRRLSIVDLEGGRQPISNEDGTVWVAYNGELFNYHELLPDLLARGHRLATRCDTEAWVHLYEDHGESLFDHVNGQFALALWDRKIRTLLLPRDRMGVCPLFYTEADGWLLWASEVKALFASGLVAPQPDLKGIDYFFNFMCAGTSRTFFESVHSIPPGHYLRVKDGRVELRKYWDLDFPDAGDERRLDDPTALIEELQERLGRAVERRLMGDVPVVAYLSGGLDSTTVLGLTKTVRGDAVPTFTIGLDRAGPDERSKASESARILESSMTTVAMSRSDIANAFPELITAAEGPVLDTSCACLLRLAQAVRGQGYKIALTGEGSDEGLAGYVWFKTQKIRAALARRLPGAAIFPTLAPLARTPRRERPRGENARPAGHRRNPTGPAGSFRARHADPAALLRGRHVGRPGRTRRLQRPRRHQRPDRPLGPAQPVALRRVPRDVRRAPDDCQGRPGRPGRVDRDPLPVPRP